MGILLKAGWRRAIFNWAGWEWQSLVWSALLLQACQLPISSRVPICTIYAKAIRSSLYQCSSETCIILRTPWYLLHMFLLVFMNTLAIEYCIFCFILHLVSLGNQGMPPVYMDWILLLGGYLMSFIYKKMVLHLSWYQNFIWRSEIDEDINSNSMFFLHLFNLILRIFCSHDSDDHFPMTLPAMTESDGL